MNRRHGRPKKYAQFFLLRAAPVEEPRHSGLFIFRTLHLGNSDPVSKTIPPVLELIITLLPKNPWETRKPKCRCHTHTTNRQPCAHNATKGSSEQSVLILSACMFLTLHYSFLQHKALPLITLHIPFGEHRTNPGNDPGSALNALGTFLSSHFPDPQKCGSSAHPYRKWR